LLGGSRDDDSRRENAQLRVTLVADGHKSLHLTPDGSGRLGWQTMIATKERKRSCYFEIVDRSRDGHIVVDKIVFSDSPQPPPLALPVDRRVRALLDSPRLDSLAALAEAYQELFAAALERGAEDPSAERLLAALPPSGKREDLAVLLPPSEREPLQVHQSRRAELDQGVPESVFGMTSIDREPHNVRIHLRGNHKNLGAEVPRQFLQVIAGDRQQPFVRGSGRLELAEWMVNSANPLTARVMVNRIWKHHFVEGIVRSVDNFGRTGDRPSHPELLDRLARQFIDGGWSVKELHREIVLSSTYRMASLATEKASRVDPDNRLLSHMPVRRLEAEAIRDSVLAVAGTLNRTLYGPGVPPHISEYQDGRGKPASGPLDGEGRRSIYIQVRRNFLTPLFLAFDYPLPISAIGRRSISAVPSQALILLNNEFVNAQAARWAEGAMERHADGRARIEDMFLRAFGRAPERSEIQDVMEFLDRQGRRYGQAGPEDARAWRDLAHVLLNTTEFIYVR